MGLGATSPERHARCPAGLTAYHRLRFSNSTIPAAVLDAGTW